MTDEVYKLKADIAPFTFSENSRLPAIGGFDIQIVLRLYTQLALQVGTWTSVQLWDFEEQLRLECDRLTKEREALFKKLLALKKRNVMFVLFGRVVHAASNGRYFAPSPEPYLEGEYLVEIRWRTCWIEFTPEQLGAAMFFLEMGGYFIIEEPISRQIGLLVHPTKLFAAEMKKAQTLRLN